MQTLNPSAWPACLVLIKSSQIKLPCLNTDEQPEEQPRQPQFGMPWACEGVATWWITDGYGLPIIVGMDGEETRQGLLKVKNFVVDFWSFVGWSLSLSFGCYWFLGSDDRTMVWSQSWWFQPPQKKQFCNDRIRSRGEDFASLLLGFEKF